MKQLERLLKDGSETGGSLADKFNNNVQDTAILVTNLRSEMLSLTKLPTFRTSQQLNHVKILTGDAELEIIPFKTADRAGQNKFVFTLSEKVLIPTVLHIELTEQGDHNLITLTGVIDIIAFDAAVYGGGRFGPNVKDYYFKGAISADGLTISIEMTNPAYIAGASANLQLSVYESGKPYNVTSEEHVYNMLKDLRRETVTYNIGHIPNKVECTTAAALLSYYVNDVTFWGVDHDFYIQDTDSALLFLIKYRGGPANTHADVAGNFWVESLALAA